MTTKPPYQQSPEDLYAAYTSNREGLTSQQAKQNQERYGKNKLAEKKKKPIWLVFLEQFKDFLVIILIIAGFLKAFKDNKYVKSAFYGLRPASTGLIAAAGLSVLSLVLLNKDAYAVSGSFMDLFSLPGLIMMAVLYYFTAKCKKTN